MRGLCREAESLLGVLFGDPTQHLTLRIADASLVDVEPRLETMRWWTDEELDQPLPSSREVVAAVVVENPFDICRFESDERMEPADPDPDWGIGRIRATLPKSSLGGVVAITVALCSAVRWGSGRIYEERPLYRGTERPFAPGDTTGLIDYLKLPPGRRHPREAAIELLDKTGMGTIGLNLILEGQDNIGYVVKCGGDTDERTIRGLGVSMAGPLEARPLHRWLRARSDRSVRGEAWTDDDGAQLDALLAEVTPWSDWLDEDVFGWRRRPAPNGPFWMRLDRERLGELAACCIPVATSLGQGILEVSNDPDVIGEWER
jgi:hypothetical protein